MAKDKINVTLPESVSRSYDNFERDTHSFTFRAGLRLAKNRLPDLPTIDIDRPQGEWIEHKYAEEYDGLIQSNFECSKCHDWLREKTGYCPNCGVRMESDEE